MLRERAQCLNVWLAKHYEASQLAYRPDYTEVVRRLIVAGHLAKDPAGDVEVLKAFWEFTPEPTHPDLTPPVLVYADLMATLDPRNIEVAGIIRKQYIDGRATEI